MNHPDTHISDYVADVGGPDVHVLVGPKQHTQLRGVETCEVTGVDVGGTRTADMVLYTGVRQLEYACLCGWASSRICCCRLAATHGA